MNNLQTKTFQNATGKIDYTLTNDCMFQSVMRTNNKVLKGLLCALLHLNPDDVQTVTILNPFEYGEAIRNKNFILDIKVILDNAAIINIELQVRKEDFWDDRSLSYLCRLFDQLKKGNSYSNIKPAYHIGILNFTLFPEYPEFYATNKMMNVKKHHIYNDKFTLNVLDLNKIELATDEDKLWKLDYWARLFKAKTWEDLKMLAQQDAIFKETCQTIFQQNQDDVVRSWCEALEEGERVARTIEQNYKNQIAKRDAIILEQNAALAMKDSTIAEKDSTIAEKDSTIAEMDSALAEKDAQIALLMAQLKIQ